MPTKYNPEYYLANKERHQATMKAYYTEKKDERMAKQKAYYQANKDEINARRRKKRTTAGRVPLD
jgi:cytochrome c553